MSFYDVPQEIEAARLSRPENKMCMDCGNTPAMWASVTFGTYICVNCAGEHRSLGADVSFVRSLLLDKWNDQQIAFMVKGGNARAKAFLPPISKIRERYTSPEARKYAAMLRKEVMEHLGITEDPQSSQSNTTQTTLDPRLRRFAGATSISSSDFEGNGKVDDKQPVCCWCC